MTATTTRLRLPYLSAAQAQKHVTVNEALLMLDALLAARALDKDLDTPPTGPAEGDGYIVAAGASGAWTGWDGSFAQIEDGSWRRYLPFEGMLAWVADEGTFYVHDGSAWQSFASGPPGPGLAAGGSGGQVARKASPTDYDTEWHTLTAADVGLGDVDNTSDADKPVSTAQQAALDLKLDASGAREKLTANRTYYVDGGTGDDGNDGLSGGTAFATIQKAVNTAAGLDLDVYNVTISIAAGTYAEAVALKRCIGAGSVTIVGDEATPSNVVVSAPSGDCFNAPYVVTTYYLRGMKLTTAGANCINGRGAGEIIFRNLNFGSAVQDHITSIQGSRVTADGAYAISGGAQRHARALDGGVIATAARTVTITNTPTFSVAFVEVARVGAMIAQSMTFSGSATGTRYSVYLNGAIYVNGAPSTYFPGDAAGMSASGGQYA